MKAQIERIERSSLNKKHCIFVNHKGRLIPPMQKIKSIKSKKQFRNLHPKIYIDAILNFYKKMSIKK